MFLKKGFHQCLANINKNPFHGVIKMATSITVYGSALSTIFKGSMDLTTGTTVGVYLSESDTAIDHADDTVSDVLASNAETAANNIARKTQDLDTNSITRSGSTITFDLTDVTWTSLGTSETLHTAVLYEVKTNDDDHVPIAFIDLDGVTLTGSDFTIQWHANGVFQASIS